MHTRSGTYTAVAALVAVLALPACNLPGLPGDGGNADADLDVRPTDDGTRPPPDDADRKCDPDETDEDGEPRWPRCTPTGGVMRCLDGGTEIEFGQCADDEICRDGQCRPVTNQCDTPLPFRLSHSRLAFESNGRLRSASASVDVENCSDFEIRLGRASVGYRPASAFPRDLEIFSIPDRYPVEGMRIPAGQKKTVRVNYEPRYGFFLDRVPSLELDIRGARVHVAELAMDRRILCLSPPAGVEIGRLTPGEATAVEVPIYNCGTVRAEVTSPTVEDSDTDGDSGEGPPIVRQIQPDDPPTRTVAPGGVTYLPLELQAHHSGTVAVDARVTGRRAPAPDATSGSGSGGSTRPQRLSTSLRGRVVAEECAVDHPPGRPEYRRRGEERWSTGETIRLRPGRTLQLRPERRGLRSTAERFHTTRRPDRSQARLKRPPDPTANHLEFRPDVPGTYRIELDHQADGAPPSCRVGDLRIDVRPEAPLYVELDWSSMEDPIHDDRGYGRGVDLDLHVKKTGNGASRTRWTGESDCFERGDEPGRYCFDERGRVRSVSVSGAGVEAIALNQLDTATFTMAVRAWNAYRFAGALADIRVYTGGDLADGFPMTARFDRNANGTVWFVGAYDPKSGRFQIADEVRKGFER